MRGALLLVVVIAVIFTAPYVALRMRVRDRAPRADRLVRAVMALLWLRTVVPPAMALLRPGTRAAADQLGYVPLGAREQLLVRLLEACVYAVAAAAVVSRIGRERRSGRQSVGWLAVALLPWFALMASSLLAGGGAPRRVWMYPVVVVAVWSAAPALTAFETLGTLTAATAALALLMGKLTPTAGLRFDPGNRNIKAAFLSDGVLAGPFSHSNVLGIALAAGLPFVLLLRGWRRRVAVSLVLVAAVWTGSRTALLAIAITLTVGFLFARARRVAQGALAVVGVLVVAVPLLTHDPAAFTARGRIWIRSLEIFGDHPLLGEGPDFYARNALVANDFGSGAFHGHNLFVNTLTTSGLVGAAALLCVLLAAFRTTRERGTVVVMVLAALLGLGLLESPWAPFDPTGFMVWLPLTGLLVAATRNAEVPGDGVGVMHNDEKAPPVREMRQGGALVGGG